MTQSLVLGHSRKLFLYICVRLDIFSITPSAYRAFRKGKEKISALFCGVYASHIRAQKCPCGRPDARTAGHIPQLASTGYLSCLEKNTSLVKIAP